MRNDNPPKANLDEGDDIIDAVISQVNVVTNVNKWVVDSGATRHICANKSMFTSHIVVGDGEEQVYLGDSCDTFYPNIHIYIHENMKLHKMILFNKHKGPNVGKRFTFALITKLKTYRLRV